MATKNIISGLLITVVLGTTALYSQKPDKIQGIAKEDKPLSYYQEQSGLWKLLIEKDPKNAEAWHYYYRAERARLQLQKPELWPNRKEMFYQELNPILDNAKLSIANTFEYHYLKGLNSSGDSSIDALKKAYAIDPNRTEIYGWLFVYYAPLFDKANLSELATKMLESNIYSNANLLWNYNALQSVAKNGVIITNGDMDGIPKWVLQYGANIRPDVLVISKWFLADHKNYLGKVLERLNLKLSLKSMSDFNTMAEYVDYLTAEVLKNTKRPIYMSSGTSIEFFRKYGLEENMYVVGNVLKYSRQKFNNTAIIKTNFEKKYMLEYLFKNFQHHTEDDVVKGQMNLTYLPGLMHLKNHYKATNQNEKVDYYDSVINKIAKDSGRKEEVLSWWLEQ